VVDLVGHHREVEAPAQLRQFSRRAAERQALVGCGRSGSCRGRPPGAFELLFQGVDDQPVRVHRQGHRFQPVVGEDFSGKEIGRLLDEDGVPRLAEQGADQVEGLGGAVVTSRWPGSTGMP